jgi:serine protease Do
MDQKFNKTLISFLVILSFLAGIVGGIGGISIVATSPALQKSLGISSNSGALSITNTGKTESISVKEDSVVVDSVKRVSPAVVSVIFSKDVQVINPFSFYGGQQTTTQNQQGGGSGFIVTSDGLIATNKHVAGIDGAKYSVITQDGKKYDAKVLSLDPISDFAILKIEANNLPTVEFGNSDDLDVGQRVIAIGNALGEFQNTVTVGVLSGKERSITASDATGSSSETLDGLLQIDAAINEGNSGGPLLNIKGQVVGVNTATAAKSTAEGLGFAIPINTLKVAVDSAAKTGKIIRPYLGVRYQMIDSKTAAIKGMKDVRGVLVIGDPTQNIPAVQKDSPADKAGIQEGDVILRINNDSIESGRTLIGLLSKYAPDQEITVKILRGTDEKDIKVKLAAYPS